MELTRAHFKVLDFASDEAPLWELPWPLTAYPESGERVDVHAAMSREDVLPVLEALVRQGCVELYKLNSKRQPILSSEDALQVIRDDANWLLPDEREHEDHYALLLTNKGDEAFRQACEQHT